MSSFVQDPALVPIPMSAEDVAQRVEQGTMDPAILSEMAAQGVITGGGVPAQELTPATPPAPDVDPTGELGEAEATAHVEALRQVLTRMPSAKQGAVLKRLAELEGGLQGAAKDLTKQLTRSLQHQSHAAGLQQLVTEQKAAAQAEALSRQAAIEAEHERQSRALEGLRWDAVQDAEGVLREAQVDYDLKAQQGLQVPPMFIAAQTITAIGNAIGMAMGAAAGILAGTGGNPVAPIAAMASRQIDKMIDRDLQAQRFGMRTAAGRVSLARTALSDLRQRYGDEKMALKAHRVMALETAQRELEAQLAQVDTSDMAQQSVAIQVQDELKQKHAAAVMELQKQAINSQMPALNLRARIYAEKATLEARRQEIQAEQLSQPMETAGTMRGPGFELQVKKKMPTTIETKLRERVFGFAHMGNALDQAILAARDLPETGEWVGQERQLLDQIHNNIILASRSVDGTGANFTEKEMEMAEKAYLAGKRLGGVDMFKGMLGVLQQAKKNLAFRGRAMAGAYADYVDYVPTQPEGTSEELSGLGE